MNVCISCDLDFTGVRDVPPRGLLLREPPPCVFPRRWGDLGLPGLLGHRLIALGARSRPLPHYDVHQEAYHRRENNGPGTDHLRPPSQVSVPNDVHDGPDHETEKGKKKDAGHPRPHGRMVTARIRHVLSRRPASQLSSVTEPLDQRRGSPALSPGGLGDQARDHELGAANQRDAGVQRLQLGDVILIQPPDGAIIEAQVVGESPEVVRELERSESTVRARLRVAGRDDFVMVWPLDTRVTLVRGP